MANTQMATRQDQAKTGEALTLKQKVRTVGEMLNLVGDKIQLALPKGFTKEKFISIVMNAVTTNEKLADCTKESMMRSVMQSAQLGLEVDGFLGHAFLIPRFNSKERVMECSLQVGYKGMIELVMRSGKVAAVFARVVYEKDIFDEETNLSGDVLVHKRYRGADRGEPIAAYAIARMANGAARYEVLWKDEIEALRARGGDRSFSPWTTDWSEMAKKSAIRRLCKTLPVSIEDARLIEIATRVDEGQDIPQTHVPAGDVTDAEIEPAPIKKLEALTAALPAATTQSAP